MLYFSISMRGRSHQLDSTKTTFVRLKQRVNKTGSVKERQRTERSLKMTPREDRILKRLTRQLPFSTTNTLRSQRIVNGRISRRIVNRRLNSARFRARKLIKRPLLTIRHKTARLQWARDHMGWLLPSVADSLALCGLCDLALTSIRIGRLANG
jgi:hypothetical protein